MKLKPMTDFVLELQGNELMSKIGILAINYSNFLKTPLKLEMFVPCDEDGNFLEEPGQFQEWLKSDHYFNASESVCHQCRIYKKAKEKVIFEGFEIEYTKEDTPCFFLYNEKIGCNVFLDKSFGVRHETIEDLIGLDIECAFTF